MHSLAGSIPESHRPEPYRYSSRIWRSDEFVRWIEARVFPKSADPRRKSFYVSDRDRHLVPLLIHSGTSLHKRSSDKANLTRSPPSSPCGTRFTRNSSEVQYVPQPVQGHWLDNGLGRLGERQDESAGRAPSSITGRTLVLGTISLPAPHMTLLALFNFSPAWPSREAISQITWALMLFGNEI